MIPSRLLTGCLGFAMLALVTQGCASQRGQEQRLTELDTQVRQLRAATDRMEERIAAMEAALHAPSTDHSSTVLGKTNERPPNLPVVQVRPNDTAATESDSPVVGNESQGTDAAGVRTLIVGEGNRIETRSADEASGSFSESRRVGVKKKGESGSSHEHSAGVPHTGDQAR